ncbi:SPDEF factor, partial [Geococcyx californianus]|nr:SPDEF factor [Geococcyx californianus]
SPSPPGTPEQPLPAFCLHYFDMLYSEDFAWATKGMGEPSQSGGQGGRGEPQKEPEQCPIIDSQGLGLGAEGDLEEHSLEQVQTMVLGEVLKDIETACKLLNIAAGGCPRSPPQGSAGPWGAARRGSKGAMAVRPSPAPSCTPCILAGQRQGGMELFSLLQDGEENVMLPHPVSFSPTPSCTGGDASWADSKVDSSCAGQPIHLWQFLKELLLKPHNYGRFIRWLNKEKG